ncbi:MAG: menaquinone biosynthesis protein [Desulfovibrionaceae bacterium]|nr:menaquinone biosynthesis protein [Desulfovibrionaceae bacterium]
MNSHLLSLGRIEFINVAPVYYALEHNLIPHHFSIIRANPARLNEKMQAGELTISSCSSIEYARRWRNYVLARDLSISSHAPVRSVLLLAKKDIEQWDGEEIFISGQSHTSVVLTKLILQERYGFANTYRTGNVTQKINDGAIPEIILTIGDEALRLQKSAIYPKAYDLASLWKDWTKLPFVFALWIVQKKAARTLVDDPTESIRASRDMGLRNLTPVIQEVLGKTPLTHNELERYYRESLTYSLGEKECQGLERFYTMAHTAGYLAEVPKIEFLS